MNDYQNIRKLEWIFSPNKIESIVQKHLINKTIFLKSLEDPPKIRIIEILPNFLYRISSDSIMELNKDYVCYRVLGRYIEIHFKIIQIGSIKGIYDIQIHSIGISLIERENIRIPVKNNEVYLTNFLTSKHLINPATRIIPTTIKVGFSEFENKIKTLYDIVKIDVFETSDILINLVKKTEKSIFVPDSFDMNSFAIEQENIINLKKSFPSNFHEVIQRYRKNNIKSEIISPLYYLTHDNNYIKIGFIQIQNKNKPLTWDDLEKIKIWNKELIERMQQINTEIIQEKEELINISRNGFRAKIRHLNLISYLIKQSGFSCDIIFKGYPPISVYAEIRSSARDDKGILYVGTQIVNFKKEQTKNQFLNIIDTFEKKYKIMQIKTTN